MARIGRSISRGVPRCSSNQARVRRPGVGGGLGVVARPDVAVEPVLGAGVAHDVVRHVGAVELLAQPLDVVDGDRPVLVAEQAEPRRLELADAVDQRRELREPRR